MQRRSFTEAAVRWSRTISSVRLVLHVNLPAATCGRSICRTSEVVQDEGDSRSQLLGLSGEVVQRLGDGRSVPAQSPGPHNCCSLIRAMTYASVDQNHAGAVDRWEAGLPVMTDTGTSCLADIERRSGNTAASASMTTPVSSTSIPRLSNKVCSSSSVPSGAVSCLFEWSISSCAASASAVLSSPAAVTLA